MERPAATRVDWKTQPLPPQHATVEGDRLPEISFSAQEFARIGRGFVPRAMEDKWFAFAEGDRLFLHRSWTGMAIYEADFQAVGDRHRLARLRINRDPAQYGATDDVWDVRLFAWLVDVLLLERPSAYPHQSGGDALANDLRRWSVGGQAGR